MMTEGTNEAIINRVSNITTPILDGMGIELVEIVCQRAKRRWLLRIFIDKEGGVTIDDCEQVSREVGAILDVEDIIPASYILEVSSPGLDRALKKAKDYKRYMGRLVRITTGIPVEQQRFFVGRITAVEGDEIIIDTGKQTIKIPFNIIKRGNLEVEFGGIR